MSTSLQQAAATGVNALRADPVAKQFVAQLSSLVDAWICQQGYVIEQTALIGDCLLNGNLGKRSAFFQLKNPDGGEPMRIVCEIRAFAQDVTLFALLQVRQLGKGPNPWKSRDSAKVQVHYPSHPGEYKLQLATQRLRDLIGMDEQVKQLEDTSVLPMLQAVMAEARASAML